MRRLSEPTRQGLVKKTDLMEYSRPRAGGIIAIDLMEGDELIDVALTTPKDELVLSTRDRGSVSARSLERHLTASGFDQIARANDAPGKSRRGIVPAGG